MTGSPIVVFIDGGQQLMGEEGVECASAMEWPEAQGTMAGEQRGPLHAVEGKKNIKG